MLPQKNVGKYFLLLIGSILILFGFLTKLISILMSTISLDSNYVSNKKSSVAYLNSPPVHSLHLRNYLQKILSILQLTISSIFNYGNWHLLGMRWRPQLKYCVFCQVLHALLVFRLTLVVFLDRVSHHKTRLSEIYRLELRFARRAKLYGTEWMQMKI